MSELPVPVRVDSETGVWSVDGQPMILMPRHFWVYVQMDMEKRFGLAEAQALMFDATRRAARVWCEREAKAHTLSGADILRHYLKRMGQRGLGRFTIEDADWKTGRARVRLEHSVYVAEYGPHIGRPVCYMFTGALVGGMETAVRSAGGAARLEAQEVHCGAAGADHCLFEVRPR